MVLQAACGGSTRCRPRSLTSILPCSLAMSLQVIIMILLVMFAMPVFDVSGGRAGVRSGWVPACAGVWLRVFGCPFAASWFQQLCSTASCRTLILALALPTRPLPAPPCSWLLWRRPHA